MSNTISGNNFSGNTRGISLNTGGNTICGNTISGNTYGISILSYSNTISGNTVSSNTYGIYIESSGSNTISGNLVSANTYGFYLESSNSNIIHHNNIVDNTNQVYNYESTNTWNNGDGKGNYWSDYSGLDDGSGGRVANDGIGDTEIPHPYTDQGDGYYQLDNYPLTNAWSPDPVDAIGQLKAYIEELEIPHGTKNSLIKQLEAAENALANEQDNTAVNILNAFIHHVEALRGNKLTEEQADYMISSAEAIIDLINGV
jgi:parallel beta-helix repeat protein